MPSVLFPWVRKLTLAMQGTLLTCVRGPDGIRKDHPVKQFIRVYRRAILRGAKPVPGDFMTAQPFLHVDEAMARGIVPAAPRWGSADYYLAIQEWWEKNVDDLPHHWLLHFCHCAEIVGCYHPDSYARRFWFVVYEGIVKSFHMIPESKEALDQRLRERGGPY